jgi:hypothetical protein
MSRIVPIACAGALALATALAGATPAFADSHGDAAGAAIAGGVLGFMAGAATAGEGADVGYDRAPPRFHRGSRIHVQMCLDHYGWRYDPRTDLVHWRGRVFRCDDWPGRPPPPRPRFGPPPGYDPSPGYGPPPPDYGY